MTHPNAEVLRPVLLIILDGFGLREDAPDNAISRAHMPFWQKLWREHPHTTLEASELRVGLPRGQMGNSEVGHLNIGAGRVVYQDYTRVDEAIARGEWSQLPVLNSMIDAVKKTKGTLHVLGLLSEGGVHSHENHLIEMVRLAVAKGVEKVVVHAFLDGRDTPPQSAEPSLKKMQSVCDELSNAYIGTVTGRYHAMDRDKRWDRVEKAYRVIVQGEGVYQSATPLEALQAAYHRGETDEFVQPTTILDANGMPHLVNDGDAIIFMNFRADRARQLTEALTDSAFQGFVRTSFPALAAFVTLTSYGDAFSHLPCVFAPQSLDDTLGEVLAKQGIKQLRIAETEKYAHVTYFLSGGMETPYEGEERILIESPKVATYDLAPAMSAEQVTDKLVAAIQSKQFGALICNYANGDMVGHSGSLNAAIQAVEALDKALARVVPAMLEAGGEVLITADHGNAEMMFDPETGQPHTAHTMNPVPLVYVGSRPAEMKYGGALEDIAPTVLTLMGLPVPKAMTGTAQVSIIST